MSDKRNIFLENTEETDKKKKRKKGEGREQSTAVKVYKYFLPNAWKKYKMYFVIRVIKLICQTAMPFFEIIMLPMLVDELVGDRSLQKIVLYVAILALGNIGLGYVNTCMDNLIQRYAEKFSVYYREQASHRIMELDFQVTEDKKALDQIELARNGMDWYSGGLDGIVGALFTVIQNVLTLVGISTIVLINAPWLLLLIMGVLFVTGLLNNKNNKVEQEEYKTMSKVNRIFSYLGWQIVDFRYGKDIRLYNAKNMMLDNYDYYCGQITDAWYDMAGRQLLPTLLMDLCDVVRDFGTYMYVGILAVTGKISLGVTTQLFTASAQLYGNMRSLVVNVQDIVKKTNYAYEYVKLMDFPEAIHKGTKPVTHGPHVFEFKDVEFAYPGSDVKVLRGVNLKIETGEHLSIVGLNGAGKTTFVKLLCRLYDPTDGVILMDGVDIKEYDYNSYMQEFAPVFQDFKLFAFTFKENITLKDSDFATMEDVDADSNKYPGTKKATNADLSGDARTVGKLKKATNADLSGDARTEEELMEETRIAEVFEKVGLTEKIGELEKGADTYVFKHYDKDGIEPSGGEQQKLAIGRALYKDSPVVILDEPTAALDPIAEYEIYKKFEELVGGKTAVYISHRLSSCQFCDKIAVFSDGVVAEYGTHASLVKDGGLYAKMFNAQAMYYAE